MHTHTYPTYDTYKASGVDWLGDVPEEWEVEQAKWLFKRMERPIRIEDEIVTCFRDGEVTLRKNRRKDGFTTALKEHGYQGIRKGDLVIHQMDSFAGAIGISDSDGKSTPVYSACVPYDVTTTSSEFYCLFLRNLAHSGFISSLAKGIRERSTDFRFSDFAILKLPLPPIETQHRIVSFLDEKTVQIDQAIALKQQQIDTLNEYKQIIIQNAVTKGLNPHAPMKASGVEWIGDIPEHWEVRRLKEFCKAFGRIGFRGYTTSDFVNKGDGAITISPSNIKANMMNFDKCSYINWEKYLESPEIQIKNNDILIVKTGSTYGKIGLVTNMPQEATINPQLLVLKDIRIDTFYFYYALKIDVIQIQIQQAVVGSTIPTISENKILKFKIALPPREEQKAIAEHINSTNKKIDQTIDTSKQQIARLQEYKTILINDAVTGKIRVEE